MFKLAGIFVLKSLCCLSSWSASLNVVLRNMLKERKGCWFSLMKSSNMNWWSNIQAGCVVTVSELLSLKSDQRKELLKESALEVGILLWQVKTRLQ